MKKIIAAFDGLRYSESTKDYAIFMAKEMNAHLVGIFLDDITRYGFSVQEVASLDGSFDQNFENYRSRDNATRKESAQRFEKNCQAAGINFSVHHNQNVALQELLHESVFADLLVVNSDATMTRAEELPPTGFIKGLLNDVQCPVLLVPKNFKPIKKVVMLYDGEPSSVYAVKMFSYLASSLTAMPTEIFSVSEEDNSKQLPDERLMTEFMQRHYPKAEYNITKGRAEEKIRQNIRHQKEDVLVVLGAYRRSRMSRVFKPSMADILMSESTAPLFIAHNK